MDGITSVLNQNSLSINADGRAAQASTQLAQDFDQFLSLLTTQLQNQDPLEPMDSSEFTNQLVQFSSVEQQIATNTNLESLVSMMAAQGDGALLGYLGKDIVAQTPLTALTEDGASWLYDIGSDADDVSLTIRDENGLVVATADGETTAGIHELTWDGLSLQGTQLTSGFYRLEISAVSESGADIATTAYQRGTATEIDKTGSETLVKIGALPVSPNTILAVKDLPKQTTNIQ